MKKLFVHLSILCLLAVLLVPMVGCKKDDNGEDTPMTDTATTDTTEPIVTDITTEPVGTGLDTDMTTEPMGTDMSTPPAQ
jgi:hypothetical protein